MKPGAVAFDEALIEHSSFAKNLGSIGAEVTFFPFVHGAQDSVFAKDNVILSHDDRKTRALLTMPATPERKREQAARLRALEQLGITDLECSSYLLEGGDVVVSQSGFAFLGHGFRSEERAAASLGLFLKREITTLELVDSRFYHLDTALGLVHTGSGVKAFAIEAAFSKESWQKLIHHPYLDEVVPVELSEALRLGLNWIEVGSVVLTGSHTPKIAAQLRRAGKRVVVSQLSQFHLAGGSAACLAAPIYAPARATVRPALQHSYA